MSNKPKYMVIGGDAPAIFDDPKDAETDADRSDGEFIDWPQWYEEHGYGALKVAPKEGADRAALEAALEPAYVGADNGWPPVIYGCRTGWGRAIYTTWWKRLGEFLRRPEMWLRRLLITAWVLVPARPKDIASPRRRRKLWPIAYSPKIFAHTVGYSLDDKSEPPFVYRTLYMRVVPVLRQSIVNRVPRFVLRLLARLRIIGVFTNMYGPRHLLYGDEGTLLASSNTGVIASVESGVYDPMENYRLKKGAEDG